MLKCDSCWLASQLPTAVGTMHCWPNTVSGIVRHLMVTLASCSYNRHVTCVVIGLANSILLVHAVQICSLEQL